MPIPLNFRVPNPPPTFVGRERELREIRAAMGRAPVVLVCGIGGLGKTSLVLASAKKIVPDRVRAAVMIRMTAQTGETAQQAKVEIVRALGALAGKKADALSLGSLGSDDDLMALALDLAESQGALVVLDDVHHAGLDVLVAAARFARRSLWLATSRIVPDDPELVGQIVRLGPLLDGKLAAMARLLAPRVSATAVRDAVRAASGSPWRLRSALLGEPTRDSPLDGLDDSSRAVLSALKTAERALSTTVLASATGGDVTHAVAALERRGLVEIVAGRVRLHDAARPWLDDGDRSRVSPVAGALSSSTDDADAIDALSLLLASGDEIAALALCDARGSALLRAGYAPTMWKLVAPLDDARWYSWKLRAAIQIASVDVVKTLPPPSRDALADRVLWSRALLVRGDLAGARHETDDLLRASDAGVAFWAGVIHAMAVHHGESAEAGVPILRGLDPPDTSASALRDALLAFWVAECGDPDGALALLARRAEVSADAIDVLGAPLAFFVRYYRMAALMECGHLDEAHAAMIEGAQDDLGEDLAAARVAGNALVNLAIARGRLDEARHRLDRLARSATPTPLSHVTTLLGLERRIAVGDFSGVDRALSDLAVATEKQIPLVHAWCFETRERLDVLFGREPRGRVELESLPLGPGTRMILALRRAIHEARWSRSVDVPAAAPRDIEGAILHAMLSKDAPRAIELARAHGWRIRELEARALACETTMAIDDIAAFRARSEEIGSARFAAEAELLAELTAQSVDAPLLERLADAIDVSPIAARRARALLGAKDVPLDDVDRALLARARGRAKISTLNAGKEWQRGWGMDVERRLLWREDGTTSSLARHDLYVRILATIAARGGAAGVEELARDVWNVKTFHPLEDGNRIRVTMHRIRSMLGAERIVLRDSAYALGGPPFRIVG